MFHELCADFILVLSIRAGHAGVRDTVMHPEPACRHVSKSSACIDAACFLQASTETHFKLKVVSESFNGLTAVRRHQMVYGLLDSHFKCGLHALNIVAKTPAENSKSA